VPDDDVTPGEDRLLAIIGFAGLIALAGGLAILAPTKALGFDPAGALAGLLGQLPETLPAGIAVLAVAVVELAAGAFLARLVRREPFGSWPDAILAATVAAVLKDVALLATLGQVGLFSAPALFGVDLALLAAGRWARPLVGGSGGFRSLLPSISRAGIPLALVVGLAWLGPLLLQLASPVVPFIDVLPNHVAPAEHLRTFGSFTPLTATQSPIYGPSRTLLGFTAFAGAVTTLTNLPAGLAIAGLILPTSILVGVAIYRLANAVGGPGAGWWSLFTFAMTASFARLGDVRATVVVLPIVAWSLVLVAGRLNRAATSNRRGYLSESVLAGLGLGAAVLVHPVIGALAVATVGMLAILLPARLGRFGITAVIVGGILGLPQALTMVGIALPAIALLVALAGAIVAGAILDRLPPMTVHPPPDGFWAIAGLAAVLLGVAVLVGIVLDESVAKLVGTNGLLLAAALVGVLALAPAARSPIVLAAATAGLAVAIGTVFIPVKELGLLGTALRFELPKTLYYWLPVFAAIAAGSAVATLWGDSDRAAAETTARPSFIARLRSALDGLDLGRFSVAAVALFVVAGIAPFRLEPQCPTEDGSTCMDAFWLGDHRLSEDLAIDLRFLEHGFWSGYPDRRHVVDPPRAELIALVKQEIAAGRIGPETQVLHVARSFQQWEATPIGVFTGAAETDATLQTEHSIHTVGGRLHDLDELPGLLASRAYAYVVFEPNEELPPGIRQSIIDAGYASIFANVQGELFRIAGA
jgi:hypothetical protein